MPAEPAAYTAFYAPGPSPTPQASTVLTLTPNADAYVYAASPATNYGSSSIVRTLVSPEQRSYLRFEVAGVGAQAVTRATLRLHANGSSPAGFTVHGVADTGWAERGLTFGNMPPVGVALGSSGAHGGGAYVVVDVTGHITGDGLFTLAMTTTSTKAVSYPSREASANFPQLVLELAP